MRSSLMLGWFVCACDGGADDSSPTLQDRDGDGWYGIDGGGDDCNDDDDRIFPYAPEICDGVDDDCNNQIDDGVTVTLFVDDDADGYGSSATQIQGCATMAGWSSEDGDCDDHDTSVFPDAPELCDEIDNDCDASTDESPADIERYHLDADGDGYGDANDGGLSDCPAPGISFVSNGEDCNDANALVNPLGHEVCDGDDNDCDGLWNESDPDLTEPLLTQYVDADADGYGAGDPRDLCWELVGWATQDGDCDDVNPDIHPGSLEICDAMDNDCDLLVDDDDTILSNATYWYADDDLDGYGFGVGVKACIAPAGRVTSGDDCDDTDSSVNPAALEVCDTLDNDCDGNLDEDAWDGTTYWRDSDGDGFGNDGSSENFCDVPGSSWILTSGDCDDSDSSAYPGATESCNHTDDDCDGLDDSEDTDTPADVTFYADSDGDGFGDPDVTTLGCQKPAGYSSNHFDCDDTDATMHTTVTTYADEDGDGFGDPDARKSACGPTIGYVADDTDCDDTDDTINPDGTEIWYDGLDEDCDGANDDDQDHDGFTSDARSGDDCDDLTPTVHLYAYEDDTDGIDNDCDGDADAADGDAKVALVLGDDDFANIAFSSVAFPFCGTDYSDVYVGSNGYLTFDVGDDDHSESVTELLAEPRVAGFWVDLDPSTAGAVEWIEYADAVGVYFRGVDVYAGSELIDFGMILLDDGRIVLDYGDVTSTKAMVGWSCGAGGAIVGNPEVDLLAETYAAPWDALGIGTGTEDLLYQYYQGTGDEFDTPNRAVVYCVNSGTDSDGDGWTDDCGDPDDTDASITP